MTNIYNSNTSNNIYIEDYTIYPEDYIVYSENYNLEPEYNLILDNSFNNVSTNKNVFYNNNKIKIIFIIFIILLIIFIIFYF